MRLFVALDLDDATLEKVVHFMEGVRAFAPDARWLRPESLHVTLKFIGQTLNQGLREIENTLQTIRADSFELRVGEYGFFPEAKAPSVFWIGVQAGPQLKSLAADIDAKLTSLGVPKEEHPFRPHLTLARLASGSRSAKKNKQDRSNQAFAGLRVQLSALGTLDFGVMIARQLFLYQSDPSPGGSRYTKLMAFPLA